MDEAGLVQEVERMTDWSVQFLEHISSFPVYGEYTAGNLANRYIFHRKIRDEQSIADAVEYDIKMGQNPHQADYKFDEVMGDVFSGMKKKAQRWLAVSLENNPQILYDGDRRGRLYRHKKTRPSIRARDVAVFISNYLYHHPEEFNIRDLGEEVREWATDFHMKLEENDQTRFYRSEPNKSHLLPLSLYRPQTTEFPFSFNHPDLMSKYNREYESDLSKWCENVYAEKWFRHSVSNILRYLRKDLNCISEGSKRGLWVHQSHSRKAMFDTPQSAFTFTDIMEFDNHFSRLHNRVTSFEDPDVVSIMLKQLEGQLALMLHRIKKHLIRDFPPIQEHPRLFHELDHMYNRGDELAPLPQGELSLGSNARNHRIKNRIQRFLKVRPRNTAEILEHVNSTMRHGTTAQQLGDVLSKDKDIVKVGYVKRSGILSDVYDIEEWATRQWLSSNCPGWKEGTPVTIDDDGNVTTAASTD